MNAALYMRMSTDKQENSIDSQQEVLLSYAKNKNMNIVEKYIDEGISGRMAEKRPAFMQMIDDSTKALFQTVLVYDSSRFARNLEESIVYKSMLKRNGVQLISITEPTLDDDSALITDAMLGAINEMFSRKLSKAVKRGMVYNAQNGIFQTAPPYGYVKQNGKLEILKEEAEIVKYIFNMFIQRPSCHSIAVELNGMNIKKRKSYGWYSRDIKRMLTSPVYIGNLVYDGIVYKGKHPSIIDIETWEKTKSLINHKSKQRPPSTYKHWLSGLLRCSHCGGKMNIATNTKGYISYRCAKNANGCCAYSNFISVFKLETLMKNALLEMMYDEDLIRHQYLAASPPKFNELEWLQASLKKLNAKLARHKEAYSAGVDTLEEYKNNKKRCQNEERILLNKINACSVKSVAEEKVKNLKISASQLLDFLFSDHYAIEQKSMAIHNIVEKIMFNKNTGEFIVFYFL